MPVPQNIRGIKRKRPNDKELEDDKEAKLRRKLYHALRELRKVVKKARTFEVQKTLKKLKDARHKDPEGDITMDLEAQMEILKHLNHNQFAHSVLITKLRKDKTLSADPTIQVVLVELAPNLVSPGVPGTPTAKVQSRILSSKVLASEVISIVQTLRTFLHLPTGSEGIEEATDPHASPNIPKKRIGISREEGAFSYKDSGTDPSGGGSDGGHESAGGDEAVAEADDSWESGTIGMPSESDDSMVGAPGDHDLSSDSSETGFLSGGPKNKKSRSHRSKIRPEFLPSLSVGFTRGDSEFSDSETKFMDGIKRNRRGQRARRAIWEKKFGKNANHIKKQQQKETEHRQPGSVPVDRRSEKGNPSLRPRRTPIWSRALLYGHEQVSRPSVRGSEGTNNLGSTEGQSEHSRRKGEVRGKQGERPLHPSWEAKRKQKSAGIVPSQGIKIVFSES